jgi:hypothetical protein
LMTAVGMLIVALSMVQLFRAFDCPSPPFAR